MCCMAPATLIDPRIEWQEIDDHLVQAAFNNQGLRVVAMLQFNDKGQLINFISNDRYNAEAKKIALVHPFKRVQIHSGISVSSAADAVYSDTKGDFIYGTFQLTDLEYNGYLNKR